MVQIYMNLNSLIIIGQFLCLKCFNISGQNCSQWAKCFNRPNFYTTHCSKYLCLRFLSQKNHDQQAKLAKSVFRKNYLEIQFKIQ